MIIRGKTQWEIAEYLGVSQVTVSRDIQWLRSVAKKELKNMLEKKVPEEYHRYLVGIDEILRHTWEIALSSLHEKIRLDAFQFVIDCFKHKVDVIVNPTVFKSNNSDNNFTRNQKGIKKISI
jgi:predicted transcriptional regulator